MSIEVAQDYKSSLEDLTQNSKPLISMLTMLAEENRRYAGEIMQVIQAHLKKANPKAKLPTMYLLDSIMKNAPNSPYVSLITNSIVDMFCETFDEVDEKVRQAMYKLRQTWTEILPNYQLYALDVRVGETLDPAWPITATPEDAPTTPSIHVNPRFLNKGINEELLKQQEELRKQEEQEADMRKQLIAKQQELLRIQQQKLELELAETKAKLEAQARELALKEKMLAQKAQLIQAQSGYSATTIALEPLYSPGIAVYHPTGSRYGDPAPMVGTVPPLVPHLSSDSLSPSSKSPDKPGIKSTATIKNPRLAGKRDPRMRDPRLANKITSDSQQVVTPAINTGEGVAVETGGADNRIVEFYQPPRRIAHSPTNIKSKPEPVIKPDIKKNLGQDFDKTLGTTNEINASSSIPDKKDSPRTVKSRDELHKVGDKKADTRKGTEGKSPRKDEDNDKKVVKRGSKSKSADKGNVPEKKPVTGDRSDSRSSHSGSRKNDKNRRGRSYRNKRDRSDSPDSGYRRDRFRRRRSWTRSRSRSPKTSKSPPQILDGGDSQKSEARKNNAPKKSNDSKKEGLKKKKVERQNTGMDSECKNVKKRGQPLLPSPIHLKRRDDDQDKKAVGDQPALKKSKTQDTHVDKDLSTLFGCEDTDYRSKPILGPKQLEIDEAYQQNNIRVPGNSQWRKSDSDENHDIRPLIDQPVFPAHLMFDINIPKSLESEQRGEIVRQADLRLKEGKMSKEDHIELMKKLSELQDLQQRRMQMRTDTEDNMTGFSGNGSRPAQWDRDHRDHPIQVMGGQYEKDSSAPWSGMKRDSLARIKKIKGAKNPEDSVIRGGRSPLDMDNYDLSDIKVPSLMKRTLLPTPEDIDRMPPDRRGRDLPFSGPHQSDQELSMPMVGPPLDMRMGPDFVPPDKMGYPDHFDMPFQRPRLMPGMRPFERMSMRPFVPNLPTRMGLNSLHSMPPKEPLLGPQSSLGPDVTHEVYIDDRPYELLLGSEPRKIKIDGQDFIVRADTESREILINDKCYYRIGDAVREVVLAGKPRKMFYHGPLKNMWVNGIQYEVRIDAPPQRLLVGDKAFEVKIHSTDYEVVVNGTECGKFGGSTRVVEIDGSTLELCYDQPGKQILIDGTMCNVSFDRVHPVVTIRGRERRVAFDGPPRDICIDGRVFNVSVDRKKRVKILNQYHTLALGGPGFEVIINGKFYEVLFNGPPREITLSGKKHMLSLPGNPPDVKVLDESDDDMDEVRDERGMSDDGPRFSPDAHKLPPLKDPRLKPQSLVPFPPPPMNNRNAPQPLFYPNHAPLRSTLPGPPEHRMRDLASKRLPHKEQVTDFKNELGAAESSQKKSEIKKQDQVKNGTKRESSDPLLQKNDVFSLSRTLGDLRAPELTKRPEITPEVQAVSGVDVNDLFAKLLSTGIISKKEEVEEAKNPLQPDVDIPVCDEIFEDVPELTQFKSDELKVRYTGVIQRIYSGIQCSSCAERFPIQDMDKYRQHLDWHFRQNKREKEGLKVARNRRWYYDITNWITFESVEDSETARSDVFETALQASQGMTSAESTEPISCPTATGKENDNICDVCKDPFMQFWDEDEEEWHLKDAIRVNGKTYHPVCYDDYKESSVLVPSTPTSPNLMSPTGKPEPSIPRVLASPPKTNTQPADSEENAPDITNSKEESVDISSNSIKKENMISGNSDINENNAVEARVEASSSNIEDRNVIDASSSNIKEESVVDAGSSNIEEESVLDASSSNIKEENMIDASSSNIEDNVVDASSSNIKEDIVVDARNIKEENVVDASSRNIKNNVVDASSSNIKEDNMVDASSSNIKEDNEVDASCSNIKEENVVDASSNINVLVKAEPMEVVASNVVEGVGPSTSADINTIPDGTETDIESTDLQADTVHKRENHVGATNVSDTVTEKLRCT